MAYLQVAAPGNGLLPNSALANIPLVPLFSSLPEEEMEDGLGGRADLDRPVATRNQAARVALQNRVRGAIARVALETSKQVRLGRLTLLGMLFLQLARLSDYAVGGGCAPDGGPLFAIQFLCVSSDMGCLVLMAPLFLQRLGGHSPMFGYMGPMITGLAALSIVDACAFVAFLVTALRAPVSPGRLRTSTTDMFIDAVFANLGVWDVALVGSTCLQASLCICSWRVYKSVREAGLYPAGDPGRPVTKVSITEVFCDEPDVSLDVCQLCAGGSDQQAVENAAAAPPRAAPASQAAPAPPRPSSDEGQLRREGAQGRECATPTRPKRRWTVKKPGNPGESPDGSTTASSKSTPCTTRS